jgi:diacylglycerol diphosphate phosphatase / phosphatidate phosphatase
MTTSFDSIFAIAFLAGKEVPVLQGPFSLTDRDIHYPYHPDQIIPVWLAVVLTGVVPIVIIGLLTVAPLGHQAKYRSRSLRMHDFNIAGLGFGYAVALAMLFSTTFTFLAARPRPDFIARCQPDPAIYKNDTVMLVQGGVVHASVCTHPDSSLLINSGYGSWPSGHCAVGLCNSPDG